MESTGIGLFETIDNLEEGSHCPRILRQKDNFIVLLHIEIKILKQYFPIDTLGQSTNFQYPVSGFPVGKENDSGIFSRRGLNFVDVELLQHLFAAGGLLGFGHVGTETGDELHQFFPFFLGLLVLCLLLTKCQLTGLIPETIVTGKQLNLSKIYVHRMGTNRIQKVPVV